MCTAVTLGPITNKVEALKFAVLTTMGNNEDGSNKVNYDEALKLFQFMCANVEFPADQTSVYLEEMMEMVKQMLADRHTPERCDC